MNMAFTEFNQRDTAVKLAGMKNSQTQSHETYLKNQS